LPGAALAAATYSVSVLYFESAAVISRKGELATWMTGVKSLTGSTLPVFWIAGAMIMLSAWPITMS
jgi:hypothetical protein